MTRAWIEWVDEHQASGEIADVYGRARARFTFVPDVVKVFSIRPEVAVAQEKLRSVLLGDASSLGARKANLIGAAVSGMNHCQYCGTAHTGLLTLDGDMTEDEAVTVYRNWHELDLVQDERAMLMFAEKLTYSPSQMEEADVEVLRNVGFTDENIFDIVLLVAYRNYMNRINDGLGVMPDRLEGRFGASLLKAITTQT